MKIGILQTGRAPDEAQPEYGDYNDFFIRYLKGRGFDFQTYAVLDGDIPKSPADAQGWLITGSKFGAYEDHAWIPPLEAYLRDTFAAEVPIFGVCFGHQILAQALGGKVAKYPQGWSVGPQTYKSDLFGDQKMIAWHQDQVVTRPAQACVAGSSAFCENAILTYGNHALTIQPHPEFSVPFFHALLDHRGGVLPDTIRQQASNADTNNLSSQAFADTVEDFFKRRGKFAHTAQKTGSSKSLR
jgi:GMP synthase (glutamine-hydrolysing)